MAENEPILTVEDIKNIELAMPIIRALTKVEPLLAKASQAHTLLADVKRLEATQARMKSEIQEQHAVAVRNLDRALDQARAAAEVEAAQKQEHADGKLQAAEDHLKRLQRDAERTQENLTQTKLKLDREIELLRQSIVRHSEESSQAIARARQELEATRQATAKELAQPIAEKAKLQQDIMHLKAEKQRIATELKAVLGG